VIFLFAVVDSFSIWAELTNSTQEVEVMELVAQVVLVVGSD
jgi:hypothetical protein